MRFIIAKPENKMSLGDLFYSVPNPYAMKEFKEYDDIINECREKAERELSGSGIEQLEKEITAVENTSNKMAVCIIKAIAELSAGMGYPVSISGDESGMVLMYLLGASSVHPRQIGQFRYPSEKVINDMYSSEKRFTLAIAEPVRVHIQKELDRRFSVYDANYGVYKTISLPGWEVLEDVKGNTFNSDYSICCSAEYNNAIQNLYRELYEDLFSESVDNNKNFSFEDLCRLYSYSKCSRSCTKDIHQFNALKELLFKDDIYELLVKEGIPNIVALDIANKGFWHFRKQTTINYLLQFENLRKYESLFNELPQVWSKSTCAERLNICLRQRMSNQ